MQIKLLLVVVLLSACGLDASESWLQGAIVNGAKHNGHPSVVQLRVGSSLCTATLIGNRTALTAAHCVKPGNTHYLVVDGLWHTVASYKQHASYSAAGHPNDIALAFLGAPIGVKPTPISTLPPNFGQTITMIGYGKTGESALDSGTKRIATTTLSSMTATRLKYYTQGLGNICNGDSGGPSFATIQGQEVQVGVHSLKYGTCGDGGADTRVDAYKDWIVKNSGGDALQGPKAQPQPAPTPKPGDADGDGVLDEDDLCSKTPPGAKVWTSGEWRGCASGQTKDPAPPPKPDPPKPKPDPPKPDPPKPDPGPTADADGDGVPDDEDRCDKTPPKWHQGVNTSGAYKGCYPNGDVITD